MKKKLIAAALGSIFACMTLPALSQNSPQLAPAAPQVQADTVVDAPIAMNDSQEEAAPDFSNEDNSKPPVPTLVTPASNSAYHPPAILAPDYSLPTPKESTSFYPGETSVAATSDKQADEAVDTAVNDTTLADASVVGLKPFTQEAGYMSLAGKLRYDTYASTGVWMDHNQAVAAAKSQIESASR